MWPFKKRNAPKEMPSITATTVICIPGSWNNIDELKNAIFSSSNGEYMVVGEILLSIKKERHYKFEICGRDERMTASFKYTGKTTAISDDCLNKIEKHTFLIYISGETGGLKEAENIAFAGAAVLKAGGIGIKIDTAGKAFEKSKWLNLAKNFDETDLYQMFVASPIVDEKLGVFSCGMHNLGLKDTIIYGEEPQRSIDLVSIFGYYQIFDKPVILPHQTFQPDLQSPKYLITDEPNQPYNGGGLFENPYGMWRLTRI
jgi:hypothetical protein